jgi:hypothetical protein
MKHLSAQAAFRFEPPFASMHEMKIGEAKSPASADL